MFLSDWSEIAPGVWRTVTGTPDPLTPLSVVSSAPKLEAIAKMGTVPFPLETNSIELDQASRKQVVRFPLTKEENIFGMGLQFMRMNQRGRTRYLRVNSDPKQDTGETHAPVPFYVSDRGYGVLVNTSRIVTVHCGSTMRLDETRSEHAVDRNEGKNWRATPVSDSLELVLPEEGAEVYLFAGKTVLDVVRRYNLYCGGGALPPRWGLGFWHRVPKLYNDQEVLQEAMEFRKRDFPCDVIGLEPGWHSKSYPVSYEWSKERFPKPADFVNRMAKEGFQINLWEHPYVSPDAELYEPLKPLSGSYSVWGGLAPDYTLPEAQALYQNQHEKVHVNIGISGFKLDECDGSELTGNSWMFPAHAKFPSGNDGEQLRQVYGLLFQQMTTDLYKKHDRRTYGLVRASTTGASSLPYVLYSDLYDHRQFIRALCNSSFSGLLWTPEVRRAASAEDWVRRMQAVCFSPLAMLNAWGDGTKPWSFPEVEPIIRHYIQLRMRLLPYLYTAFARYHFDGTPPFRAMPLADSSKQASEQTTQDAANVDTVTAAYGGRGKKEWDDQYMMGDSLLIAPLFAGETARDVYLPAGIWYGLETGERYEGGAVVRVEPGLEKIPVFVKDGSVIPMMPADAHVPAKGDKVALEIRHFGEQPGEFLLYDDDGESYAYERGEYTWHKLQVEKSADGTFKGSITDEASLATFDEISWQFGLKSLPASK